MPPEPVVDVIVATNRVSPFLRETLAGVVAQTWPAWRLTVVDDGSPDANAVAAEVAAVPGAQLVRVSPGGVSAARNTGLAASSGDLVVFLDDDDVWEPEKLERQVAALHSRPDALGSYTGGVSVDEHGWPMAHRWDARPASRHDLMRLDRELPRITTLMVRREAVAAVGGFDVRYPSSEDIAFALDLLQLGPLVPVDEELTRYRRHTANMTRTIAMAEQFGVHEQVWRERVDRARREGRLDDARALRTGLRRVRQRSAADALPRLRHTVRAGRTGEAWRDLAWCARRAPGSVVVGAVRRLRQRP